MIVRLISLRGLKADGGTTEGTSRWRAVAFLIFALAGLLGSAAHVSAQDEGNSPSAQPPTSSPGAAAKPPANERPGELDRKTGHGSVSFKIGVYHQEDQGGNPNLDEEMTVIEPIAIFTYNVTDDVALNVELSYDNVSAASIERLTNYPQQSGASGDYFIGGRVGLEVAASDEIRLNGNVALSTEYDYQSLGVGGGLAWDLFEKNTTLAASISAYFDSIDVMRLTEEQATGGVGLFPVSTRFGFQVIPDGQTLESADRTSITLTLDWYQILTEHLHMDLGYTLTDQWGFLESNINTVYILASGRGPAPFLDTLLPGFETREVLPGRRLRQALYGKIRWYIPAETGTSLELSSRAYTDDWGISSGTIEPRLYQWLVDDVLLARLRYRLYFQRGTHYYHRNISHIPRYRTQDPDLAPFLSHTYGVKLTWYVTEAFSADAALDFMDTSNGLDGILVDFGLTWRF